MPAITLYQFAGEGSLSLSPYCNKVHWALRLKGLAYRTVDLLSPKRVSATGKLPVLEYDGERIHDSTEIIRFLERLHPAPALIPASRRDAAHAHVIEEWADEALSPFCGYYRWRDAAGLGRLAEIALPTLPPALGRMAMSVPRAMYRRRLAHLGRRGEAWVRAQLEANLDAVDALAEGRTWLVGDAPSVADLGVAAQLHALTVGVTPEPHAWLRARPHASAWLERFLARAARVAEREAAGDGAALSGTA
jgi:glutathione S-transferase